MIEIAKRYLLIPNTSKVINRQERYMISLNYDYPYYSTHQVQIVKGHPKYKHSDLKDLAWEILNEMFESIDSRISALGYPPRNKQVAKSYTNWCNQLNLYPVAENLIHQLQLEAKTMEGMKEQQFTTEYIYGTMRKRKSTIDVLHSPIQLSDNSKLIPRCSKMPRGERK